MSLSGHFPQVLGDEAENDFKLLARSLGYRIVRRRNPTPGIDFIADHVESPGTPLRLKRPLFSPEGRTAFSVKRGEFRSSDVDDLERYLSEARSSSDGTLNSIAGGVLVTGTLLTETKLDRLSSRGVHCWDIRRLIFYSYKARVVSQSLSLGPVRESLMSSLSGTLMMLPQRTERSTMFVKLYVFIDDHNLSLQRDHMERILDEAYSIALLPTIEATGFDIQASVSLHSIGPVQSELILDAYQDWSGNQANHRGAFLAAAPALEIQSYAAAPWTSLFRM